MKTIAIIDDDEYIGNMLQKLLEQEGYGTLRAYSGTEALLLLERNRPDLVLLDLMLPGISGEEVLKEICKIPVIVVSAKAAVEDKVDLLTGGAVDYITKPFDNRELLARIAVNMRRAERGTFEEKFEFNGLVLDNSSREVMADGSPVRLTKTEYAILRLLMRNAGQVITKSRMLELISEDTPDCMESSLKVHVSNLRGKLREATSRDYIEAVWGIGFKLRQE